MVIGMHTHKIGYFQGLPVSKGWYENLKIKLQISNGFISNIQSNTANLN